MVLFIQKCYVIFVILLKYFGMLVLWHIMSSLVPFRSMYVPVYLSCLARAIVSASEKVALVCILWADAYLLKFKKAVYISVQIEKNFM